MKSVSYTVADAYARKSSRETRVTRYLVQIVNFSGFHLAIQVG